MSIAQLHLKGPAASMHPAFERCVRPPVNSRDGRPVRSRLSGKQKINLAEPVRFGGDGAQTILIIAAFRFRATHRTQSVQRLAPSIHIPAGDAATSPLLQPAMQLLAAASAARASGSPSL